jgi:hypothetical protein
MPALSPTQILSQAHGSALSTAAADKDEVHGEA